MRKQLVEINDIYLQIQDIYLIDGEELVRMDDGGRLDFLRRRNASIYLYEEAIKKFNDIYTLLTVPEVMEAYEQGCVLLKCNLGGLMYLHFNAAYTDLMIMSIKRDDKPANFFLHALLKHVPGRNNEIADLAVLALNSKFPATREAALSLVAILDRRDTYAKVQSLIEDENYEVSEAAKSIIDEWG